jgi:predicted DNA-binding protein
MLGYSEYRRIIGQINIRIEKEIDDLFTYLSERMDIPKAVYARITSELVLLMIE